MALAIEEPRGRTIDRVSLVLATVATVFLGWLVGSGGEIKLAIVFLVGVIGAAVVFARPLIGAIGLVFITYTNFSDIMITVHGLPSVSKQIAPFLMLVLAGRWFFFYEKPFFHGLATFLLACFGGLIAFGAVHAAEPDLAIEGFEDFVKNAVLALVILAFLRERNAFRSITWALLAAAGFLCTIACYKYAVGAWHMDFGGFARTIYEERRLAGPLEDPNFFAAMLVFILPLAADRAMHGVTLAWRMLGAYIGVVVLIAIVLTTSRGALVAMAAMLVAAGLFYEARVVVRLVVVACIAALCGAVLLSDELIERFAVLIEILSPHASAAATDTSVQGRLAEWMVALQLFLDNPLLGVGIGGYNAHFQDYSLDLGLMARGADRSAHGLYVEILAEMGIVGFILFAIIVGCAIFAVRRALTMLSEPHQARDRAEVAAFGLAVVGYLAAMTFLHDAYPRFLWMILVIAIALPQIVERWRGVSAVPLAHALVLDRNRRRATEYA